MKRISLPLTVAYLLIFFAAGNAFATEREKASAMRLGRMKAMSCAGCHGMDGKGIRRDGKEVAPAYVDSAILKGDPETLALIILKGIHSESEHYSSAMAGMEQIYDDRSLAAVMTWIRNQFGGHDDVVTPEQAAAWRETFSDRQGPVALGELGD